MISSNGNDFQPSFTTSSNQNVFFRWGMLEMFLTKMISNVLEMRISCQKKTISIWKWFFLNDLLPQKMISGCFWRKKMIYRCEKSFPSSSEMIFYTRKWFRRNSKMIFVKWFLEHFVPVLKMWFTLGKKTISFGNGHFRKWTEIIFFQKMLDILRIFFWKQHHPAYYSYIFFSRFTQSIK